MIAASVKDGEKLVDFLLSKGADPNEKSKFLSLFQMIDHLPCVTDNLGQVSRILTHASHSPPDNK